MIRSVAAFSATCLFAMASLVVAHADTPPLTFPDIMPISQVKAGMVGYGLTVFRGTLIEKFYVRIVDVVRKGSLIAPGHDMILVKMSGGPMTLRGANVIHGMSGSPIYINGKIIGAFSQGEPASKEPLGGVTPIQDMLEAWDPNLPVTTSDSGAILATSLNTAELHSPIIRNGHRISHVQFNTPGTKLFVHRSDTVYLQPCTTIATFSSSSASVRSKLTKMLAPYNVELATGVSGAQDPQFKGTALLPGAAFGMMLVTGDLSMGAFGTVTYRQGNKLIGFGHPFMGMGAVDAAFCSAYVHDVYPLLTASYKICSAGPVVGSSVQDRMFGVTGTLGQKPNTIPVTVNVVDITTKRSRVFHCQSVRHPNLFSGLVSAIAGAAVSEVRSTPGPCMAKVTTTVDIPEIGKVTRTNTCFDARSIDNAATSDLDDLLAIITGNPFYPLTIKSADIHVEMYTGRNTAVIDHIELGDNKFEPGTDAVIAVAIQPYKQSMVTKQIVIAIPRSTPSGRYAVQVKGGNSGGAVSFGGLTFRSANSGAAELSAPVSQAQMIKRYEAHEKNTDMVARLILPTNSIVLDGERMSGLPAHLDQPLRSPRLSGLRAERDEIKTVLPMPWVISGQQVVTINVVRRDVQEQSGGIGGSRFSSDTSPSSGASIPQAGFESEVSISLNNLLKSDIRALTAGQNLPIYTDGDDEIGNFNWNDLQQKAVKPVQKGAVTPLGPTTIGNSVTVPTADPSKDKPIARQPLLWKQSGKNDFSKGELIGTVVNARGEISVGPSISSVGKVDDEIVWTICKGPNGSAYAGTGPHAKVYTIKPDRTSTLLATLPETSVHTLALAKDGSLYAGTGPYGRTYKIDHNGKYSVVHTAHEKYVLSSCVDTNGDVFIGTGGGIGHVYRISSSGIVKQIPDIESDHITALAADPSGGIFIGTGNHGILFHMNRNSEVSTVYDATEPIISGIVATADSVYVSTAPRGAVYRIEGHTVKAVIDAPRGPVQCLVNAGQGPIGFGAQNIFELKSQNLESQTDTRREVEFLSACEMSDGKLLAGASVGGQIYFVDRTSSGLSQYVSQTRDAKRNANWRQLKWDGTGDVQIFTRTGNSAEPDLTWSSWAPTSGTRSERHIASPSNRFFQYRFDVASVSRAASIHDVVVSYLPDNSAPKITMAAFNSADTWSGKQTLKWEASDPDKDVLSFDLLYQKDGESSWTPVPAASEIKTTTKTALPGTPPLTIAQGVDRLKEVQAELDKHPDIPPALREAVLQRAKELAAAPVTQLIAAPASTRESSRAFETSQVSDGIYRFKVIASDRPSNAEGFLSDEAISSPITICNSKPVLVIGKEGVENGPVGTTVITGYAMQTMVNVTSVQVRVDSGDWLSAAPANGPFDRSLVGFKFTTQKLTAGEHKVEVKAFNSAGNSEVETIKVTGK
ncbi:MAG: hypothetical protein ABJA67_14505 [Chthonomonadales bacterium]